MKNFKQILLSVIFVFILANVGWGQISITSLGSAYTQNFNTLASTGTSNPWTDNSTITGWYSNRIVYIADAGTNTTGGIHSYGTDAADRSLGALSSGSTSPILGVRLVNNTGSTATSFSISYKGEQWRQTANAQTLVFEYQVGATSLTTGIWTPVTALDFTALKTGTAGALDGNAAGNYSDISNTVTISVTNGQEIWFRWSKTGSTSPGLGVDDVSITANGSSSGPTISMIPNTLTGFSYIQGSGPSTAQNFIISGSNLTADISISAPTNYEISLSENSGYTTPIVLTQSGGTVGNTTIYVRLKSGLTAGNYNLEDITATSTGATDKTVSCSGTVYKLEPTNHVTAFTTIAGSPDYSSIVVTWLDASGSTLPDYYLIKGSSVSYASIVDPVDGIAESDGMLVKNIAQGLESVTFINLTGNTTYYFKIFPYTNSGTNINYKTDGVVPQTERTTTVAPAVLLEENFDYTVSSLLTDNGWTAHSGTGTNNITVTSSSITYPGYVSSGIGQEVTLAANGQDVNRAIASVNSGSVYATFMVNVLSSLEPGDYFAHFSQQTGTTGVTTFAGRVWVKKDPSSTNFAFGISKSSTTANISYTGYDYSIGTTYLIVVKYNFIEGLTNDNAVLFINPVLSSTEPTPTLSTLIADDGTTDPTSFLSFCLRQGSSSNAPSLKLDGIRIAKTWADGPLPIALSSFNSNITGRNVKLSWVTETELNNAGFDIERAEVRNQNLEFNKIGFINGHGTANTPTSYSFEDKNLNTGKYKYRLKQVDHNGNYEYYELQGEVEVGVPKKYDISQNYPNPFNPVTKINFDLPENGLVNIRLYDMLGREVAVIVNEVRNAGYHTVQFDASKLSSGIYFYKMNAGKFNGIKKMAVIK